MKQSKAEKMFEELGYRKFYEKYYGGYYAKKDSHNNGISQITFINECIHSGEKNTIQIHFRSSELDRKVDVKTHLAIHEKMKELGWLDERSR